MSYFAQGRLASDRELRARITACAATQGVADCEQWALDALWSLSAEPGWASAYASALAANVVEPGADESVISDTMILSAIQPRLQEVET